MTAKNSKSTSKTRKPSSDYISVRKDCRACGGPLETVLDLGVQQIVNLGDKEKRSAPLTVTKCERCGLVQLRHSIDRDYLFRSGYYYRSGATQTMRDHLRGVVEDVMKRVELKAGDVVVDIGSNDGTLLRAFPDRVVKVGFEPSQIGVAEPTPPKLITVNGFFSAKTFEELKG